MSLWLRRGWIRLGRHWGRRCTVKALSGRIGGVDIDGLYHTLIALIPCCGRLAVRQ
jgi:hypothetical protein